jgi:hypothetical protein
MTTGKAPYSQVGADSTELELEHHNSAHSSQSTSLECLASFATGYAEALTSHYSKLGASFLHEGKGDALLRGTCP